MNLAERGQYIGASRISQPDGQLDEVIRLGDGFPICVGKPSLASASKPELIGVRKAGLCVLLMSHYADASLSQYRG
jgi:hypothetical protein